MIYILILKMIILKNILQCFKRFKTQKLILGDSLDFLIFYDWTCLFHNLINNELITKNNIKNILYNELSFPLIFKIELHKETVAFIFKPDQLKPIYIFGYKIILLVLLLKELI